MKVLKQVNFGLKEIINAESATTVLKNMSNETVKITGLMVATKEDLNEETGEIKTLKVGVLKTQEGELISSISPTVIGSIETIITTYEDMGIIEDISKGIDVQIKSAKSGKGREFFHLELK
jgi:hypothetical protein